jgi:uncharacterized membrane protein YfcA
MNILILIGIGLTAGILSGLFGIGGGVLVVPALIYLLGFSSHKATGTSLVILLPPVGIGAVLEYTRHGAVDWRAAIIIAITVFLGATVGAYFANKISSGTLKLLFSLFLIGLGIYSLSTSLSEAKSVHVANTNHTGHS